MNFWQGFFIGRWTKRNKSKSEPGFFSLLFGVVFAIALIYVGLYAFLVASAVAAVILFAAWRKTHSWDVVRLTFFALMGIAAIIAVIAMLVFCVIFLFSAFPALMWIGIILAVGYFFPMILKLVVFVYRTWNEL